MLISSSSASCISASRFSRSVSSLIAAILSSYCSQAGAASLDGPCAVVPASSATVDSSAAVVSAEDSAVVSAVVAGVSPVDALLEPHPARVLTTMEAASANARYFFFIIISSHE